MALMQSKANTFNKLFQKQETNWCSKSYKFKILNTFKEVKNIVELFILIFELLSLYFKSEIIYLKLVHKHI